MPVADLYTKAGQPLGRSGDRLYSRSGRYLGRIHRAKVYDAKGHYAGTIVGDRVVYRSTDSASVSSLSVAANQPRLARANAAGSAIWGDEPRFAD